MASFFKGRGEGSTPPPDNSTSPNSNKKWISGLVSGAGKIISSVFGSSDASDDDEFDDDDAEMLSSDEKDDDKSNKKLAISNQERAPGEVAETKTIMPPIRESKITIEQLITKETFSREESERLIKVIQSRVVEASSSPNKLLQKDIFNQNLEYAPLSPVQASPEMCSAAVAEAKKWLEEKRKSASSSSKTIDLRPCALSIDMSQSGMESDIGSPVDLAKSYMQSKPPWQSPFVTNSRTLFGTPPPSGSSGFSENIIHGTFNHSSSSSRFLKRDYFSTGLWDPKEESSRRVRSRLSENAAFDSISSFTLGAGSSSRLFDRDLLESHKNFSLVEGMMEPLDADVIIASSQAGKVEGMVNTSEPTLGNNVILESQQLAEKEQRSSTHENAGNVNKETGGIAEVVILETSNPNVPICEKNDAVSHNDEKIVTNEQAPLDINKNVPEPEILSDPKPHEGDLNMTVSLHGSTNKNSTNGPAVQLNTESEFESSINGGLTSGTAGPDISDDKSLNGTETRTDTKTLEEPNNTSPIRKGRKRVVSGRGRSRSKVVRGRAT